ncbi:MAG: hypothetical protein HY903_18200 [Deltaproteobacteria bacterium]|nr:hypothetical protein [Deltaproteobacteria bacterium]
MSDATRPIRPATDAAPLASGGEPTSAAAAQPTTQGSASIYSDHIERAKQGKAVNLVAPRKAVHLQPAPAAPSSDPTLPARIALWGERLDTHPDVFLLPPRSNTEAPLQCSTAQGTYVAAMIGPELRAVALEPKNRASLTAELEARLRRANPELVDADIRLVAADLHKTALLVLRQWSDAQLLENRARLEDTGPRVLAATLRALPAFQALPPWYQRRLAAVVEGPTNRRLADARERLAEHLQWDGFRTASPEGQAISLMAWLRRTEQPSVTALAADLSALPGVAALPEDTRTRLRLLIGGPESALCADARWELFMFLDDTRLASLSTADQASRLAAWLRDYPPGHAPVNTKGHTFDSRRQSFGLSPVVAADPAPLGLKQATVDCVSQTVTLGAHTLRVIRPAVGVETPGRFVATTEMLAAALAALPPALASLVRVVYVEQDDDPMNAHNAAIYGDPTFRAFMSVNADGVVRCYPGMNGSEQTRIDGAMTHELGHLLAGSVFGGGDYDTAPGWQPWRDAITADQVAVSGYARHTKSEDFAETLELYRAVQGTADEAELRQIFKARFALLDEILARPRRPAPP